MGPLTATAGGSTQGYYLYPRVDSGTSTRHAITREITSENGTMVKFNQHASSWQGGTVRFPFTHRTTLVHL